MATSSARRSSTTLTLLFLPLLFVSSSAHTKAPPSCDVTSLCPTTPFPALCLQSTALLSPLVRDDLTHLARAFIGLSLSSARAASAYVRRTADDGSPMHRCAKSMLDCVDVLSKAASEMDRLGQPGTHEYTLRIQDVRAFVATAIADAKACLMFAVEVRTGAVVLDAAVETVRHTMQLASIGLVMVNNLNNATKN